MMRAEEWQMVQARWNEIVNALFAAGIPRDELAILADVAGAEHLSQRLPRRPIGFVPTERKEER